MFVWERFDLFQPPRAGMVGEGTSMLWDWSTRSGYAKHAIRGCRSAVWDFLSARFLAAHALGRCQLAAVVFDEVLCFSTSHFYSYFILIPLYICFFILFYSFYLILIRYKVLLIINIKIKHFLFYAYFLFVIKKEKIYFFYYSIKTFLHFTNFLLYYTLLYYFKLFYFLYRN